VRHTEAFTYAPRQRAGRSGHDDIHCDHNKYHDSNAYVAAPSSKLVPTGLRPAIGLRRHHLARRRIELSHDCHRLPESASHP
jgi:hypothetical protein